jgi:hypothetical protein
MHKVYFLALMLGLSTAAQAQIVEKPLKLEDQTAPEEQATPSNETTDTIVFPAATEPYKPVENPRPQPVAAQPQPEIQNQPVAQSRIPQEPAIPLNQQPAMQQYPQPATQKLEQYARPQQFQQPAQPTFNNVPVTNHGGMASNTSREAIERAADSCDGELTQLWQQKNNIDPARRSQFQKCMGEAKVRCDRLKESAKAFKEADAHLNSYQSNLQQAQGSVH